MRINKYIILMGMFITLVFSLIITKNTYAYNFGYTDTYNFSVNGSRQTYITNTNGGVTQTWTGTGQNGYTIINGSNSNNGGVINRGSISVYGSQGGNMPAGMFHFTIRWTTPGSREPINYMGITPTSDWTLLNESCFTQVEYEQNAQTQQTDLLCNYFGYTNGITAQNNGYINIDFTGNILNIQPNIGFIAVISSVDFVRIYDSGGGSGGAYPDLETDINTIMNRLNTQITQNTYINYNIEDIKDLLELLQQNQITDQDIQNAIDNARQEEKEEYQQQQEEVTDATEEASEQAQQDTATLTQNIGNIINAIIDQPATNCNIRIIRGTFDTGELNMCNVPATMKTVIMLIITIPVTLGVLRSGYELVQLYFERIREEQE